MQKRTRTWLVALVIYGGLLAIVFRLFYWQIIKGDSLQAIAQSQYERTLAFSGERGTISTSDGYVLVGNVSVYRLFANPQDVTNHEEVVSQLTPILSAYYHQQAEKNLAKKEGVLELGSYVEKEATASDQDSTDATDSGTLSEETEQRIQNLLDGQNNESTTSEIPKLEAIQDSIRLRLTDQLSKKDRTWVSLSAKIDQETKALIEALNIHGLGFDTYTIRNYPEESLAAQVVGFVGKDTYGEDLGYFGIEGALNNELKKRSTKTSIDTGILGFNVFQAKTQPKGIDGRDITLSIRRDIQYLIETELQLALEKYGAKEGEIIVLDPSSGKILGLASAPLYHPEIFHEFNSELYRNPAVSDVYEPGSTFKPLTVAAGIDSGVISPDTQCPICDKPVSVGKYQIKTWNNEYNPNITMTDALSKSDNTAMVYIGQELGVDTFKKYIELFGIGKQTTDEIQEDTNTPFPNKWGPVEVATRSFGQGISVTSLQLIRAIAAIANKGTLMQLTLLESVYDPITDTSLPTQPREIRQVVSPETAEQVTQMMVASAEHGEAQWTASRTHTIAAKTGTAQIAVEGGYDPDKTIASYVGFGPAKDPKYVMLVKLTEPTSSPWASETAAPLWHKIAKQLHLLLEIPPDKL